MGQLGTIVHTIETGIYLEIRSSWESEKKICLNITDIISNQ